MRQPMKALLIGVILSIGLFSQAALAVDPYFRMDLTLDTYWKHDLTVGQAYRPVVDSHATAELWDNAAKTRLYRTIILQHGVADSNIGYLVFTASLESLNGYMNSSTNDFPGDAGHCYVAMEVAHSNDYNLHQRFHPDQADCMPSNPPEHVVDPPKENCPVLLDLDLDGFHLSGPDPAVRFDIDADGAPDQIAWTRAGDDDAFLCLDRNHNGIIDDGTELFGYATPLHTGERAVIGYDALADLDRPALQGNADGKIDAGDAMFSSLCVWNDGNRDGVSQPGEIQPAAAAGVVSLDYAFRTIGRRDAFGNLFRYVSRMEMRRQGRVRTWFNYDVIFADANP